MALGNTPTRETTISVEASKSFVLGVLFEYVDGTAVDVSGDTLRFVAVNSTFTEVLTVEADPDIDNPAMQQFSFQADDLTLTPGTYLYDVTRIEADGFSTPILKGTLEIGANADSFDTNEFTQHSNGSDITVYLREHDLVQVKLNRGDRGPKGEGAIVVEGRDPEISPRGVFYLDIDAPDLELPGPPVPGPQGPAGSVGPQGPAGSASNVTGGTFYQLYPGGAPAYVDIPLTASPTGNWTGGASSYKAESGTTACVVSGSCLITGPALRVFAIGNFGETDLIAFQWYAIAY